MGTFSLVRCGSRRVVKVLVGNHFGVLRGSSSLTFVRPRQLRDLRSKEERVLRHLLRAPAPETSVVRGTFLLFNSFDRVLFNSGASHSFIATSFACTLELEIENIRPPLIVETPIGGRSPLNRICRDCELIIRDHRFTFDFIVLNMSGFDLILGMDWLFTFHATIDCFRHRVRICPHGGSCSEFFRERREPLEPYLCGSREQESVYALLASLALDEDVSARGELPLVVCDFSDVFPKELPGLPLEREIEFSIDLLPGTIPIFVPSYRFAPTELRE
ncbi:uncharacterized protein LOC131298638 [Rhododendron vialii]|uniref:uncharacterized protein LOC131298638 n=1 Tax=Rhododendron vialii TaxID=182163 RepID=UPI00265E4897|nr:uncharacterized protein LOC131298638 [Rhododendron vialii]